MNTQNYCILHRTVIHLQTSPALINSRFTCVVYTFEPSIIELMDK